MIETARRKRTDLAGGGNTFLVAVGNTTLSFSRIANIAASPEFDTFVEGGTNDRVYTLTKPQQQAGTMVFERGVTAASAKQLAEVGLKPNGRITQPVTITVYQGIAPRKGKPVRIFGFDTGVVTRWELGELNALRGEILIERFEVAHSGLLYFEA